jgi:hypothetical protein
MVAATPMTSVKDERVFDLDFGVDDFDAKVVNESTEIYKHVFVDLPIHYPDHQCDERITRTLSLS